MRNIAKISLIFFYKNVRHFHVNLPINTVYAKTIENLFAILAEIFWSLYPYFLKKFAKICQNFMAYKFFYQKNPFVLHIGEIILQKRGSGHLQKFLHKCKKKNSFQPDHLNNLLFMQRETSRL